MKTNKGFTLIELIMVMTILGLVGMVFFPRFSSLSVQAKDTSAKGSLGAIRSVIAITYTSNLTNNVEPSIPPVLYPFMFNGNRIPIEPLSNSDSITYVSDESEIGNGIGWAYDSLRGKVWINNSQYTNY